MTSTIWPAMTDYVGAVQRPDALLAPGLRGLEVATIPPLGLPAVASGRNAVVFHALLGGRDIALRCFTSQAGLGRDRYIALEQHLSGVHHDALTPAQWIDDAVDVNGNPWPAVVMDWVEGQPLSIWVDQHVDRAEDLRAMAARWATLMSELRSLRLAHGDLQHGNVLVDGADRLRLVDFDGVWIPARHLGAPDEWGHPNYQHPARGDTGAHGEFIDWFAALTIHTSLLALAADPGLWRRHNEENLIFVVEDFEGATSIWDELDRSPDPQVRLAAQLLADGCARHPELEVDLATLLSKGFTAPASSTSASSPTAPFVADAEPNATRTSVEDTPWWETPASAATQQKPDVAPASGEPPPTRPPERNSRTSTDVNADWASDDHRATPPPPPPPPPPGLHGHPPQMTPGGASTHGHPVHHPPGQPTRAGRWLLAGAIVIVGLTLGVAVGGSDLSPELQEALIGVTALLTILGAVLVTRSVRS